MRDFERILVNLEALDLNDIFLDIWKDNKVQNYIIDLNTEGKPTSQLYELGEDSKGRSLGEYSDITKVIKLENGQRFDHITLKDTGDFYESFIVRPMKKGFKIEANPNKEDTDLFEEFGKDIVGLNEENTELLLAFVEEDFNKELMNRVFG